MKAIPVPISPSNALELYAELIGDDRLILEEKVKQASESSKKASISEKNAINAATEAKNSLELINNALETEFSSGLMFSITEEGLLKITLID